MSFNVRLQPSGNRFAVDSGETLLDAALRQNIGLPYGCRDGRCGSCSAELLSGTVDYPGGPPSALQFEPDGRCLPCQARALGDLELKVIETTSATDIQPRVLPVRVEHAEKLAHDVLRLYLKLPQGQRLQFEAGQYLDFLIEDGKRRAFSMANAPHDDELIELHIRHVDGGRFSDWAFSQMREKTILRIEAPLGCFTLDEASERPMIFMGGGTGFAPLKGQLEHAHYVGIDRPRWLYWGVRAERDLYLPDLPRRWADEWTGFNYVPVLSEPDAGWRGRTGWVHEAVLADHPDLSGFDLYMAGPPPMIIAAREAFIAAGLPEDRMFYDSFEYAAAKE